jgi:hypothetical protein
MTWQIERRKKKQRKKKEENRNRGFTGKFLEEEQVLNFCRHLRGL